MRFIGRDYYASNGTLVATMLVPDTGGTAIYISGRAVIFHAGQYDAHAEYDTEDEALKAIDTFMNGRVAVDEAVYAATHQEPR